MHIPTKFCHVHKTKFTHINKLFPHTPWTPSYKPNTKFSQCQYSQNPNQNSSNNITNHLHCQNFKSHQHSPNCTMKKKNTSRMLQSQHFQNMINHTMPPKFQNNQITISHHKTFNETCNNIFPSKETKAKLTLVSTWQYGAWVLRSWRSPSSSCHSNVGSYFLPWEARKEDTLDEEAILMQRK